MRIKEAPVLDLSMVKAFPMQFRSNARARLFPEAKGLENSPRGIEANAKNQPKNRNKFKAAKQNKIKKTKNSVRAHFFGYRKPRLVEDPPAAVRAACELGVKRLDFLLALSAAVHQITPSSQARRPALRRRRLSACSGRMRPRQAARRRTCTSKGSCSSLSRPPCRTWGRGSVPCGTCLPRPPFCGFQRHIEHFGLPLQSHHSR